VENEYGLFVAHAYPYARNRSTFLIEVDEVTWRTAGLASLDAATPVGETDQGSVSLLESAFIDDLGGRGLLTNRTRWGRFATIGLESWSSGNTVLLGDAAHTAHYTLGSGTKLALEDSIALAAALTGEASLQAAFASYEAARRPPVERFKRLAARSQAWWDSYRLRADLPVERLALSYMTRSGNLTVEHYARDQLSDTRAAPAGPRSSTSGFSLALSPTRRCTSRNVRSAPRTSTERQPRSASNGTFPKYGMRQPIVPSSVWPPRPVSRCCSPAVRIPIATAPVSTSPSGSGSRRIGAWESRCRRPSGHRLRPL
jgi:hypothetical protein